MVWLSWLRDVSTRFWKPLALIVWPPVVIIKLICTIFILSEWTSLNASVAPLPVRNSITFFHSYSHSQKVRGLSCVRLSVTKNALGDSHRVTRAHRCSPDGVNLCKLVCSTQTMLLVWKLDWNTKSSLRVYRSKGYQETLWF